MSNKEKLSNHQIVTIAVYKLGGRFQPIDTEDIAVEANRLAPGRFTWRKHADQINIENVRVFLSDAKKAKNGGYLSGSGVEGWMLTPRGLAFAESHASSFVVVSSGDPHPKARNQKWLASERERLLASDAFAKFQEGDQDSISDKDIAGFFRLDEYVTGKARERKVNRLANAFLEDPKLGPAIHLFLRLLGHGED